MVVRMRLLYARDQNSLRNKTLSDARPWPLSIQIGQCSEILSPMRPPLQFLTFMKNKFLVGDLIAQWSDLTCPSSPGINCLGRHFSWRCADVSPVRGR